MKAADVPIGEMFHYEGGLFLRIFSYDGVKALVITPVIPEDDDVEPVEAWETTPFNDYTEVEEYEKGA